MVSFPHPKAVQSKVFFTDAEATGGTISSKVYQDGTVPASHVLEAFSSDNDAFKVKVEVHAATDAWSPASVTITGGGATATTSNADTTDDETPTQPDWVQVESRVWTALVTLSDADTTGTLVATLSDGDTASCTYTRLLDPPIVTSATWGQNNGGWSGGEYPTDGETGLQTAVKSGDTIDIQLTLDSSATRVTVTDYGGDSAVSTTQHFDAAYSSGVNVIEGVVCGSRTGNRYFRVSANRDGGTYGASADTAPILMDQVGHTYSGLHSQVFTPADNFALASGQDCTGDQQITNWSAGNDVAAYASSEVTISSPAVYTEGKTYTYLAGTYRDSGTNVTLTSRRKANGKQSSTTYLIKISNAVPTLTMAGATSRLRSRASGGDKTYGLIITSNYELKEAPTCNRDSGNGDDGDALGAWSGSAPDKTWTSTIAIGEEDTKNTGASTYSWNAQTVLATTGSGLTVGTIANNSDYTVGGFEERDVAISKFDQYEPIGTMATDFDNANKLVCEYVGLGAATYVENTTDDPGSKKFTIVNSGGSFDPDGTYVKCNDSNIYDAVDYTMRIEELV